MKLVLLYVKVANANGDTVNITSYTSDSRNKPNLNGNLKDVFVVTVLFKDVGLLGPQGMNALGQLSIDWGGLGSCGGKGQLKKPDPGACDLNGCTFSCSTSNGNAKYGDYTATLYQDTTLAAGSGLSSIISVSVQLGSFACCMYVAAENYSI